MNVFGVGPTEIFIVLIVILVLFGPDKLPELAKKIGGASREIRDNLNSVNEQMNSALETSMEIDKSRMIHPAPPPAAPTIIDQAPSTQPMPDAETTTQSSRAESILAQSNDAAKNQGIDPDSIAELPPPSPPPQG